MSNFRLDVFKKAALCRNFEDTVFKYGKDKKIKSFFYLSAGQEFIPATLATIYGGKSPMIFAQHRAHSTYLSFGGDIIALIDELLGLETGNSRGMGGSPSIQGPGINMFGHDGFIGTQVPIAVGATFASQKFGITFLGDAAAEEDYVLASLGWAATKQVPLLFVVEDNNLSVLTEKKIRRSWDIVEVAKGFGLKAISVEDDPLEIKQILDKNATLPLLLNIHTERLYYHAGSGIDDYIKRDRYEIEMKTLGIEAEIMHEESKKYVEEKWQEQLKCVLNVN
jgi:TPP-dependent pyruvate/acetoin dehydrogenase alpha subunit